MIASEFNNRRQQLMGQVGHNNIAIIASASVRTRNRDVDYPFRQDSDFYYLTGFNEADALAVLYRGVNRVNIFYSVRNLMRKRLYGKVRMQGWKARHKILARMIPFRSMT